MIAGRAVFVGLDGTVSSYDPETDAWSTITRIGPGNEAREGRAVVATDDALFVWGGDASYEGLEPRADGVLVNLDDHRGCRHPDKRVLTEAMTMEDVTSSLSHRLLVQLWG